MVRELRASGVRLSGRQCNGSPRQRGAGVEEHPELSGKASQAASPAETLDEVDRWRGFHGQQESTRNLSGRGPRSRREGKAFPHEPNPGAAFLLL